MCIRDRLGTSRSFPEWHPVRSLWFDRSSLSVLSRSGSIDDTSAIIHHWVDSRAGPFSSFLEGLHRASIHLSKAPGPPRMCSDLAIWDSSSISGWGEISLVLSSLWKGEKGESDSCKANNLSLSIEKELEPFPILANSCNQWPNAVSYTHLTLPTSDLV